ncbi:MAG: hypothetical protein AB7F43_09475 [Bacteriovoracia bacterium]
MSDTAKERNYERKPIQEFKVQLSQDGKYWIFRDITTWIIPSDYIDAILRNKNQAASAEGDLSDKNQTQKGGKANDRAT